MNAESVKARLKNFAKENGCTFNEALRYYGLERTVYRISASEYANRFVLKGGILLYAMFNRRYERATTDIDLLAEKITNSAEEVRKIFQNILSVETDDAIKFDLDSVKVEDITQIREYHGLRVSAVGYIEKTRIPVSIDIGYGDVVYPNAVEMDFPVMLDMDVPKIMAYSVESVIAEKLESIISNGYLNSRYKDLYDIYILTGEKGFSFIKMREAVNETFKNRGTPLNSGTVVFAEGFIKDAVHQTRWNAFLKRKRAMVSVSLEEVMERVKEFATPLLDGKEGADLTWNTEKGCWKG